MTNQPKVLKYCSICLRKCKCLKNTLETDTNNIKWKKKLEFCVPERNWKGGSLCNKCIKELDITYGFRKRCLHSQQKELKVSNNTLTGGFGRTDSMKTFPFPKLQFYSCKKCSRKFKFRRHLYKHNLNVHNTRTPFNCLFCGKSFKSNLNKKIHEQKHLYRWCKKWNNHVMLRNLQKSERLKSNENDVKTKRTQCFTCYHCKETFKTRMSIIQHLDSKHNLEETLMTNRVENRFSPEAAKVEISSDSGEFTHNYLRGNDISFDFVSDSIKEEETVYESSTRKNRCQKNREIVSNLEDITFSDDNLNEAEKVEIEEQKLEIILKDESKNKKNKLHLEKPSHLKYKRVIRKSTKQEIFKCHICDAIFGTKYLVKRHTNNVHATEKKYKCELCNRKFTSSVYLSAHKRYHSGQRTHMCSFCGKGYITASDLYHHEKIHANKRAYKCDKCPKAFNTSSDLHKHRICVHVDRSSWKYACEFCQKRFPLKTNLDTHLKVHTGERNFTCHLCQKRCINRSVLARHVETHSNVKAFKCSICSHEYKYQKSMDIHLKKAHGVGDAKVPQREKRFFCHICPKAYSANNKLQKHIRTHTGERPFACNLCDKRFIDKSYIKQHLRAAHNIYNYNKAQENLCL